MSKEDSDKLNYEDAVATMTRIEEAKSGQRGIRGTMMIRGDNILRSTVDSITSQKLVRGLEVLKQICSTAIRENNVFDKLEFIRADYRERAHGKDLHYQLLVGLEDDFKAVVIQEYEMQDLKDRSRRQASKVKK
jgi:hypothetical protein